MNEAEYQRFLQEIDKRELSNSENYDKSILSLSSGGLAISLTILGGVGRFHWSIYLIWIFFGASIVVTIMSFLTSQEGLRKIRTYTYQDFFDKKPLPKNPWATATHLLNLSSGFFFCAAVIFLIIFGISTTSSRGEQPMSNHQEQKGAPMPTVKPGGGAPVPQGPAHPPPQPPKK